MLEGAGVRLEAISSLYESEPVACEGGLFLNAVAAVQCDVDPWALLARAKAAESAEGRSGSRGDARTLDVDILFYDEMTVETADLVLPHPRVFVRPFVLMPLFEVCGEARNPLTGRSLREDVLAALSGGRVRPRLVAGPQWWTG